MIQTIKTIDALGPLSEFERKNAPDELYYVGEPQLLTSAVKVAVVGSRKVSDEGIRRTRSFATALVKHGITVVSGLAEGVDSAAHEAAIEAGGKTIAVVGTPLDKVFPAKNRALFERIGRDHLAVSQFPVGYPSRPQNFPRRNRTMALISDATVIVEAGEKSGTRNQGWEALRLGRLLFFMGNVADDPSLSWPREMIGYGAQVLRRDHLPDIFFDIPQFTAGEEVAF